MYVPQHFAVTDRDRLFDWIERWDFATVVTMREGVPFASHLPLLLDRGLGGNGTLFGHMARANPQWRDFGDSEILAVFHGPHAYVSPTWYEGGPAVPTWNYAAVHVYARPRLIEDAAETHALLDRLSRRYESVWSMADQGERYLAGMVRGVMAFALEITRIEGKAKLSQNRKTTDRELVRERLSGSGDAAAQGVADLMQDMKEPA